LAVYTLVIRAKTVKQIVVAVSSGTINAKLLLIAVTFQSGFSVDWQRTTPHPAGMSTISRLNVLTSIAAKMLKAINYVYFLLDFIEVAPRSSGHNKFLRLLKWKRTSPPNQTVPRQNSAAPLVQ
jgi:hypothetical protein